MGNVDYERRKLMPKACPKDCWGQDQSKNYCWNCGSRLVDTPMLRCACGEIYGDCDKYCTNCGKERHELDTPKKAEVKNV